MAAKSSNVVNNVIELRSVFGKVGQVYYIQPTKDPKTGRYPTDNDEEFIKPVNSNGDIIWSDKERDSGKYFIKETEVFKIESGKTFNLDDPIEKRQWIAIKNCPFISPSRTAKDSRGNNLIDGTMGWKNKNPRYGQADLYVYVPEEDTERRLSKKDKFRQAMNFIYDDPKGAEGRVLIARLLGRNMKGVSDNEVKDYLLSIAESDPDKIINSYTGDDTSLRLLLIEAREKKVIYVKSKLFMYADNIVLGATEDAAISWMRDPKNKKALDLIRKDTFPDLYNKEEE